MLNMPGYKGLFSISAVAKLSKHDYMAYKKSIIEKQVYYATIEDAKEDAEEYGIGIGREEGIGIGREEGIGIGRKEGIGIGRKEGIGIGREEGIGIGREEGIGIGRDFMIKNLLMLEEWPISKIAEVSGQSEAYIKEIQASLK